MSKGNSGHFKGTRGETISRNKNGSRSNFSKNTYNDADSDDVKDVNIINNLNINGHKKTPVISIPNSVTKIIDRDKIIRERYYDKNGDVYLDIDYTDHNNPKNHPVPHQHHWIKDEIGRLHRSPAEIIKRKEKN